jgi:hypothetical protein
VDGRGGLVPLGGEGLGREEAGRVRLDPLPRGGGEVEGVHPGDRGHEDHAVPGEDDGAVQVLERGAEPGDEVGSGEERHGFSLSSRPEWLGTRNMVQTGLAVKISSGVPDGSGHDMSYDTSGVIGKSR